jgi:hypothetical protein
MRGEGWSWEEIDGDWLQGAQIALDPEAVVEAFNRVDALFGRGWIEATRLQRGAIGPVRGTVPTLNIAVLGEQLSVLDRATGCDRLIEKLRDHELSARAELTAIHRTAGGTPEVRVECEPTVTIGGRVKRPDFRLARDNEPWTYVEVTRPNPANAQQQLVEAMNELAGLLNTVTGTYTAEVFFHRHARIRELHAVKEQLAVLCVQGEVVATEMPNGLGVIYMNDAIAGQVVLHDRDQPYTPRLGVAWAAMEDGVTARHIAVRVPYFDDRGHNFLATEAAQLPNSGPGLIMIDTTGIAGGKEWSSVFDGELALGLYEQVSAICLLRSGMISTDQGEASQLDTAVVLNPTALHALPDWLSSRL